MPLHRPRVALALVLILCAGPPAAQDIDSAADHPLVTRYSGSDLRRQTVETYRPFRIPTGPVTGYLGISDWIDTEGRMTRSFSRYTGSDRDHAEIYRNFLTAFEAEGFEILGQGIFDDRRGTDVGARQWLDVYLAETPLSAQGEGLAITSGNATQGGAGSFVARKDRAAGPVFVVVSVEQHAADTVATLIDLVEVNRAETGLVTVDA